MSKANNPIDKRGLDPVLSSETKQAMRMNISTYRDATRPVAERVADLLGRMTLDEKVAQLHAFWLVLDEQGEHRPRPGEPVAGTEMSGHFRHRMRHGLGQISRPLGTHQVAPGVGLRTLNALQRWLREETRLGIPAIAHEECLLGVMADGATLFPSPLAYGATWHPALIEQVGEQIGREARVLGCQQGLAPVLDVSRDVRWGRTEETFGEDPYLVGVLATHYVRGLQGPARDLLATLKHFVAHSASEGGRNHAPVSIGWRELNDTYLLPFEMAVKLANAGSVMPAYHDIDGEPLHASHHLLTEVLREQWGFDGLIVADYGAISQLHKHHAVARDAAEAAAAAFNAGLDIELPDDECASNVGAAIERGLLSIERLDEIVARILTQKFRLGLFERSFADEPNVDPATRLRQPPATALALEVARQSIVLLANDGTVPLAAAALPRLAVIGPCADDPLALLGGYSFPVHLIQQDGAADNRHIVTPLQGLRARFGAAQIRYARGCAIFDERACAAAVFPGDVDPTVPPSALSTRLDGIAAAVAAARDSDVAVVCVGDLPGLFQSGTVGEGSDTDSLALPGVQQQLLTAVLDTGVPTIVVLSGGRPYNLGAEHARVAALLMSFAGGEAAGTALADVLSGTVPPSGRLTLSVPHSVGAVPCYYNHKLKAGGAPIAPHFPARYAFGHGLSTTHFDYRALRLEANAVDIETGEIVLRCELANVGTRDGIEVAQLYVRDHHASVVRPVRELKGFLRVALAVGQVAELEFRLPVDMLNLTGRDGTRQVEPGLFDLFIGASSADTRLQATVEVAGTGPRRLPKTWRMQSQATSRLL